MSQITIELANDALKEIKKRAKLNYMTPREQIEDIIRRSMVKYKNKMPIAGTKVDDRLVSLFSRERKGRKRK